jgi:molybdopterin converting factor small subunit
MMRLVHPTGALGMLEAVVSEQAGSSAVLQRIRQLSSERDALQQQLAAAQQWQGRWQEAEATLDEVLAGREAATRWGQRVMLLPPVATGTSRTVTCCLATCATV